uniref:Protein kinase domain-containing protein n=1 Tax=Oryza punctata TaxID=4537 RepID=A0A0E0MGC0_ORYPU
MAALAAAAVVVVFLLSGSPVARSQQPYGSEVADCNNKHNDTGLLGYFCSGGGGSTPSSSSSSSCQTYLTFHATPRYSDLAAIASLLGADAASLAAANSAASATTALAAGAKVLVPATCACTGAYYQRNATYVAVAGDTLFVIANNTFQGLSTCQAMQEQVLQGAPARSLQAGQGITVPLRCACPSAAQAAAGVRYLVTYLVDEFDEVGAIAARFGVDAGSISAANEMASTDTIYPFTTLLIPVKSKPNVSQLRSPPPPPPPPPMAPAPTKNRKNHTGVYVGIGVAVAVIAVVAAVLAALALRARRRRACAAVAKNGGKGNGKASPVFTGGEVSVSISEAFSGLSDIKSSLKVFAYAELTAATDGFSPDRRVGGSVYRAVFNGDAAAVEVVDRDVSAEVEIMRKINHLNLIRLIGLCHHRGRWYLVSEYAEHGTLRDRLLAGGGAGTPPPLSWAQRVQVALDVAEGLRYLHGYTRPPYVHMDVSSSSVLLAGADLRGKLRNFGGARVIRGSTDAAGGGRGEAFTMTSNIAGTRGYMAPEYLEHGIVSPKADVYSLGVVLLELVTGKDIDELEADGKGDPFAAVNALAGDLDGGANDDAAVMRRMEEFLDPAMAATGSSCPREAVAMMVRLIERCVRCDAAARPGMGEVAQHLLMMHGVSGDGWHSSLEHYRSSGGDSGEQP